MPRRCCIGCHGVLEQQQDPEDASMSSSPFPACSVHPSLRRELQHDAFLAVQSAGGLAELERALVRDECQLQSSLLSWRLLAAEQAAGWARMATAAARQRARSSDGGHQGAVRVRDVVREGIVYKCALNLRLNKYVWTVVNHFKSLWAKKATLEVDRPN